MSVRQRGMAKLKTKLYKINVVAFCWLSVEFSVEFSDQTITHDLKDMFCPFSPVRQFSSCFEWLNIGMIRMMLQNQAATETHLDMKGVRNFGEEIGWQTAMYRSALIMNRKMLLVNWLMLASMR
uniref:Uncharacterized protein n=1 Tax=Photinus pyralis TaxID=7054 RepID=A0A1Y1MRD8_PHOPY